MWRSDVERSRREGRRSGEKRDIGGGRKGPTYLPTVTTYLYLPVSQGVPEGKERRRREGKGERGTSRGD